MFMSLEGMARDNAKMIDENGDLHVTQILCPYAISGSQPGGASGGQDSSPVDSSSTGDSPYKYWNEDAQSQWLGPENLGWAFLDGVQTQVLVDNGTRVNSVMPAYVHKHN